MRTRRSRNTATWVCLLLGAIAPLLMGGCPELQNRVVDEIENAARGIVDVALDILFDQLRSSETF